MQIENIDIYKINPPHEVRNKKKLKHLVESMEKNGWQGRPLLVIERGDGFQALTGSHRLEAAREAGLDEVPCVLVDADAFYSEYDYEDLNDDETKVSILKKIGDPAAKLMQEEVNANKRKGWW